MDAAATTKGKIRQQILAGEHDIDTLSGFANQGKLQIPDGQIPPHYPPNQYPPQQYPPQLSPYGQQPAMNGSLSNHDLITPVNQRANPYPDSSSSRKGSMASMSMGRFFKRKGGAAFDDETGMDIADVSGETFTFNDIQHMRSSDSAPIIPVLDAHNPENFKNNIQYRKYMNHQKKLNLASGARAMSLAGNNPMASNSITSYPDARAMSLGNQGPRSMSLNSNATRGRVPPGANGFPQNGHPNGYMGPNAYGGGPAAYGGPGGYRPPPNGPRAMSMRSPMSPMSPGSRVPPQYMRTNSLNSNAAMGPGPMRPGPNGQSGPMMYNGHMGPPAGPMGPMGPMGPRSQSLTQGGNYYGYGPPGQLKQGPQMRSNGYHYDPYNNGQLGVPRPGPGGTPGPQGANSNDSFMNVVEEEEEKDEVEPNIDDASVGSGNSPSAPAQTPSKERDEDDLVYNFEENATSPQVSRKSTLKKNNSMRVRRLDLFKNKDSTSSPDQNATGRMSPTIDMDTIRDRESKKSMFDLDDQEIAKHQAENARKLQSLGSSLTENDKDVFLTAPEFRSPVKKSTGSQNTSPSKNDGLANSRSPPRSNTTNNIVANTAYSNFKPPAFGGEDNNSGNDSSDWTSADTDGADSSHYLGSKSTINALNQHNDIYDEESTYNNTSDSHEPGTPLPKGGLSAASRANSNADIHRFRPTSILLADQNRQNDLDVSDDESFYIKKDNRKSRSASISSKSKNFIKRLSRSGTKGSEKDLEPSGPTKKPLKFTKEDLAIMTSNNDLQNELQLVASELAQSIKRELALEAQLRSVGGHEELDTASFVDRDSQEESLQKAKIIADLQEKLNNERRLRFISEEHAILSEHGQSPSALKLDYEKNELYKALLSKTDLVNQLQDRLDDMQESKGESRDGELLQKYNELLKENAELKAMSGTSTKRLGEESQRLLSQDFDKKSLHLFRRSLTPEREADKAELMNLRSQRDELREMITKLTSSQNAELKTAYDKIKMLEDKLDQMNLFNEKLTKRDKQSVTSTSGKAAFGGASKGGKLQGLSVISSRPTLFDEE